MISIVSLSLIHIFRSAGHSPLVDNLARQHIVAPQQVDAVDLEPFAALRMDGLEEARPQVAALGGLPQPAAKLRARIPGCPLYTS